MFSLPGCTVKKERKEEVEGPLQPTFAGETAQDDNNDILLLFLRNDANSDNELQMIL